MCDRSRWIFPSKRKPAQHITRLNGAHDRICVKAKEANVSLDFVLYDLRQCLRLAWLRRVDLAALARILGHNNLRIVHKYVHPTAEHKREAMARYEESLKMMQVARTTH